MENPTACIINTRVRKHRGDKPKYTLSLSVTQTPMHPRTHVHTPTPHSETHVEQGPLFIQVAQQRRPRLLLGRRRIKADRIVLQRGVSDQRWNLGWAHGKNEWAANRLTAL
jgi:hypothetical protein